MAFIFWIETEFCILYCFSLLYTSLTVFRAIWRFFEKPSTWIFASNTMSALHCIELRWIAFYCIVLVSTSNIELQFTALHYIKFPLYCRASSYLAGVITPCNICRALHCTELQWNALHTDSIHCIAFPVHCISITLQCNALHCIVLTSGQQQQWFTLLQPTFQPVGAG